MGKFLKRKLLFKPPFSLRSKKLNKIFPFKFFPARRALQTWWMFSNKNYFFQKISSGQTLLIHAHILNTYAALTMLHRKCIPCCWIDRGMKKFKNVNHHYYFLKRFTRSLGPFSIHFLSFLHQNFPWNRHIALIR